MYRGYQQFAYVYKRFEIPVLCEYVETVLRSRQAPRVLFRWLLKNSSGKTRKEKKENRARCVAKLLEISPSAIHLRLVIFIRPSPFGAGSKRYSNRFVWRHMLKYQQNRLDTFLNAKKTFRGVFYAKPDKRGPLARTASARRKAWEEGFSADVIDRLKKEAEKEEEISKDRQEFEDEVSWPA